jgi:hypothetical protein
MQVHRTAVQSAQSTKPKRDANSCQPDLPKTLQEKAGVRETKLPTGKGHNCKQAHYQIPVHALQEKTTTHCCPARFQHTTTSSQKAAKWVAQHCCQQPAHQQPKQSLHQ